MTRIFLMFKYFVRKKDLTARGLVAVRHPTSVFVFFY